MIIAATPSSGSYLVDYDLDGILKQKDEFDIITIIGETVSQGAVIMGDTNKRTLWNLRRRSTSNFGSRLSLG